MAKHKKFKCECGRKFSMAAHLARHAGACAENAAWKPKPKAGVVHVVSEEREPCDIGEIDPATAAIRMSKFRVSVLERQVADLISVLARVTK